jgi:hypothetical protein
MKTPLSYQSISGIAATPHPRPFQMEQAVEILRRYLNHQKKNVVLEKQKEERNE